MSVIIVAACAFYLFCRIFRRKESREAERKIYHLHPKQNRRAARKARAVYNGASSNTTDYGHNYDYRGLPNNTRRSFDIDLAGAIWGDAE